MGTYLDKTGLEKVWAAVKAHDTSTLAAAKNYTDTLKTNLTNGTTVVNKATNASYADSATMATQDGDGNEISVTYIKAEELEDTLTNYATIQALEAGDIQIYFSERATCDGEGNNIINTYATKEALKATQDRIGAANGIASLDANGKVPTSQLPSYVDDILEGYAKNNYTEFWADSSTSSSKYTGEAGKIYVDLDTGKTYRWSGSQYVEISSSLALGETTTTAYAGNKGKANATNIATLQSYFTNGVANNATYADTADKAVKDGDGNEIAITYIKAEELEEVLEDYATRQALEAGDIQIYFSERANCDGQGNNIVNTYLRIDAAITEDEINDICV